MPPADLNTLRAVERDDGTFSVELPSDPLRRSGSDRRVPAGPGLEDLEVRVALAELAELAGVLYRGEDLPLAKQLILLDMCVPMLSFEDQRAVAATAVLHHLRGHPQVVAVVAQRIDVVMATRGGVSRVGRPADTLDTPERSRALTPAAWRSARRRRRMRRRSRSPAPEAPKSSIALGYPQCVELKRVPVGEASGLASFLGATEATFFLVHLACSFAAVARERFVRASLSITLEPSEPAAASQPVAWSMQPLCLPQVTELARGQKVGANFKFASVELSEESRSTRTACLIRAYNELTSDPRWEFRGRRHAELDGTQRLTMVVSTPTGASAQVTLAAHLQRPGRVPFLRRVSVLNEDNKFTLRPTSP